MNASSTCTYRQKEIGHTQGVMVVVVVVNAQTDTTALS